MFIYTFTWAQFACCHSPFWVYRFHCWGSAVSSTTILCKLLAQKERQKKWSWKENLSNKWTLFAVDLGLASGWFEYVSEETCSQERDPST